MNFNEIKQLINSNGEKVILVEDGKPTLVLMSFEDYRRIVQLPSKEKKSETFQNQSSSGQVNQEEKKELTLEDLPF
ncbi:MAG: hypothetical protein DRH33_01980 [Candidatus Nealsonbacteria bacterium]|nr:MAG: hypothetical protein DRH33_01980 [Candidatus Nealsonbacteria bacterium]